VENSALVDSQGNEDLDLLPTVEAKARLYELCDRFGVHAASILDGPKTPARAHLATHGHLLTFGCCAGSDAA
jgi:hypothetical protein